MTATATPGQSWTDPATARRRWTTDAILDAARAWHEATGRWPAQSEWNPARTRRFIVSAQAKIARHAEAIDLYDSGDFPSDSTVRDIFGSWNAMVAVLGEEPRAAGRQPRVIEPRREEQLRSHGQGMTTGPAVLATSLQHIAEARRAGDPMLLRGALYDLAAMALAWCDQLDDQDDAL